MPPKNSIKSQSQKAVEDKTFGLKNKKGKKQQMFIKKVETGMAAKVANAKKLKEQATGVKSAEDVKKEKEARKRELEEMAKLFRPVAHIKVPDGVDPKSMLCSFFKQGLCSKGAKCKFSHDLAVERKAEKRNMFEQEKKEETMETWDQAQLEAAINSKFGKQNANMPTAIICKYFLDVVERGLYGWFWECPNGAGCKYRHALPPGYVLKKDLKKDGEEVTLSLEELVEIERAKLTSGGTPVTLETFLAWKDRVARAKERTKAETKKTKEDKLQAGNQAGISGRDLFQYNPELFVDDEEAMDDTAYVRDEEE
eukprot:Ihof_evm4s110 gene=Ihof_evmTU4s110